MREADISVSDDAFDEMGLRGLVDLGRDAGLRDVTELVCRGTGAVVQVELDERYDEDALSELECVDDWEYVTETADAHVYVVSFTAPSLPEDLADTAEDLVGTCDPEVHDRGADISLVGPQDAIADNVDAYEAAGVNPELRALSGYEGTDRPLDDLTPRQREVLETAWDAGYFEVPREASTADVARELDLDDSTVSEHLQRAERNLLARHL
jgi:DNA-binding CsgD family transcriptional regulator